ncbi:MAG: chalcone isomerase family protein [Syntrophales bacterium]|nr:chalcone isomerase family protein [Syntrophales bacterium]MDY0043998.1 chalcone isomerase family protein [Syntrophales bacterium]
MKKSMLMMCVALVFLIFAAGAGGEDKEILGVKFPAEKTVDGKTLKLNGVSHMKKLWIKVYAGGLYLESPTQDPLEVIESEQTKQFYLHYLTDKATAEKLREGFVEMITENNPPELVEKHKADIDKYISWFDKGMAPGKTSVTTYVPGKGLTLEWQGEEKGTIPGKEFAQMYFRYTFGEKADAKLKKGYLGIEE